MSVRVIDLGRYIAGDDDSTLDLDINDLEGDPYDFTGATGVELVCARIGGETEVLTGAVVAPATGGILRFAKIAQELEEPALHEVRKYRGRARWTNAGATEPSYGSTEYVFELERLA